MERVEPLRPEDLSVVVSELLIATADATDPLLGGAVGDVLGRLRRSLGLDVVFVSEFVDGRRMYRFVEHGEAGTTLRAGDSNPIEESFCLRVVDGRLPRMAGDTAALGSDAAALKRAVGAYLSTPIVLGDGRVYGTVCCYELKPRPELRAGDQETLELCAKLVARKVEIAERAGVHEPPPDWKHSGGDTYRSTTW